MVILAKIINVYQIAFLILTPLVSITMFIGIIVVESEKIKDKNVMMQDVLEVLAELVLKFVLF